MGACWLVCLSVVAAAPQWEPSREYRFEGRLTAEKSETGDAVKRFELSVFTIAEADSPQTVYWALTENGRGQAPWIERFGMWDWGAKQAHRGPALYYQREDGLSIKPLPSLALMREEPLSRGAKWEAQGRQFVVTDEGEVDQHKCWIVEAKDAVGRTRRMAVDKASRVVVLLDENLFLGQGERYRLQWRLRTIDEAKPEKIQMAVRAAKSLIQVRNDAGRDRRSESADLDSKQRMAFAKVLPGFVDPTKGTPLERIVAAANRDLLTQDRRAESVASIRQRAIGRQVKEMKLKAVQGGEVTIKPGRVTVLHFWKYRDKPLKEPYGQVAYVDFLFRNRKDDGVDVYGVHVDDPNLDKNALGASVRSAKRFCQFMNLSYPVLVDEGLLDKIGDPRNAGAQLPLFVVIDGDGKVIEYKNGYYEVDRRAGLKDLDEVVSKSTGAD